MRELPENKFGYILLSINKNGEREGALVKANKIVTIYHDEEGGSLVGFGEELGMPVIDTVDEILEQLENIHPSML